MKRFKSMMIGALTAVLAVTAVGCSSSEQEQQVLNIYSWADNFDLDVIKDFEQKYNVKVNYDIYGSNEEMLAKIQAGASGYDLIQPSDYMVATMIQLGLLEELNKENIPNMKNIVSTFKTPPFDKENKYSLVYTWGITGIAYNKKYVKETPTSWSDLWNEAYKGRVIMLNDPREVMGMALIKNGFSNSTTNKDELEKSFADLKKMLPGVMAFDTDNIKQKMIAEEAWIGTVWSGDAAIINGQNPDVEYVIPKEGATIWADTLAIPKGAKHKDLAEKFINYLMDPEVSVKNYESIGYSNPNEQAYPLHSEEYRSNKMIFLDKADIDRAEWLVDVGDTLQEYDRYWTEMKSGR
ncbi:spermidine/putrescine ABC transporter substrate-binding protein [Brevibacillus agri]|uniref:Spermidine/putrescine ABC transporter substrate-binding protein n=1 Tax=Brevibacillus agri TaxID=51101 RepID=A0A3M8AGP2_9BACL|nr:MULTISPECIES: spermidine/putrescine ABC transporter substrate-binding protein [Brevibacillus]ELK41562.1 spermidine/putrescine ABC transporter substrate-binding protein [Brevibacillus agri BAB-2500]EJL40562.1 spermidine/putrescine-binding periplasmic protein [Brevibacillus sp. CF112]MBG9564460.1 spermidine/putrescine ABC transporter substrate-binding protein [Brevibacillus agri]MBY0054749.1 spermidine/putrescine ABC transporter substrate-binding protein [Brevibacillus agri]MCG5252379.1 sperm